MLTREKWDEQALMDKITTDFAELVYSHDLSNDLCLLDESSFPKKGNSSAGVARQYCGQREKIDNCQVGVFGALNAGSMVNLVQARLYNSGQSVSKIDHARNIIKHVTHTLQVGVRWVGFDAFYERDTALLASLIEDELEFVADVHDILRIWLSAFDMEIPAKKSGRDRNPKHCKPTKPSTSIREYARSLKRKDWQQIAIRYQSKGKLKSMFHRKDVYIINPLTGQPLQLILLIRKDQDGDIKHSLCHALNTPVPDY